MKISLCSIRALRALRALTLLALPLLPLSPASAAVNPGVVAADAQWLIYADLNALRASALGKELLVLLEKQQFDTGNGKVGLDWKKLSETIGSATAYGTTLSPDPKQLDGTLVIQGTADLRKIAESLLLQANLADPKAVAELTDLPFPAYAISQPSPKSAASKDAKDNKEAPAAKPSASAAEPAVLIAFPPENAILVSKSRAQILKARDVVRGAAPSLAKGAAGDLAKLTKHSDGAFLFGATTIPAEKLFPGDEGPQTRMLKMANTGAIAIGERGKDNFARAHLTAANDQMADKLLKIMQGMTAMMSLAESSDKELSDFLNSANVTREGKTVSFTLAYSSDRLAKMIQGFSQPTATSAPAAKEKSKDRPADRAAQLVYGTKLAEWTAEAGPAPAEGAPAALVTRTIENVALKNGTLLSLGCAPNGGKLARFEQIEITPVNGAGGPLVFGADFLRAGGPRGALKQLKFPGVAGTYTLKVAYVNDPAGKANYAVSAFTVRDGAPAPDATK
ncbi:MAG: hypothetical protein RLZZ15_1123 [Verrucomicrobiota bacterium]|jgi:hypothetical protein